MVNDKDKDIIKYYDRPGQFYTLSLVIPWILWFLAAYLSHKGTLSDKVSGLLLLVGLVSPTIIAFAMMYANPHLRGDFFSRIFNFSKVNPFYLFLACCLMPLSILLAQSISVLFGYSVEQFHFAHHTSFTFTLFPAWAMLILAPAIEELAWHSYGTDCLRAKFTLFTTSIIFALFWAFWHFPLSFVKGYYHSNIAQEGWIYSLNFSLSLVPFVLLMNWLYYKTKRNILVAVVFHVTAGVFNELFLTHPDSKIIQTGLLTILIVFVMCRERELFFKKSTSP